VAAAAVALVSRSCACIGSPCLRQCVHGASIGGGGGGGGVCQDTRAVAEAGAWAFDEEIAQRFDREALLHIPSYERVIELSVRVLADTLGAERADGAVIDVGCATGRTMRVSDLLAWIRSPCLRHCVHGASIGAPGRGVWAGARCGQGATHAQSCSGGVGGHGRAP
jgi:hypothetical protein